MVVEFFDYQCIWCSRFAPELEKAIKNNRKVRYFFMEWPVFGSRWPASLLAAKTGLQVWKEQGAEAYLKYHNDLYGTGLNEGKLTKVGSFNFSRAADRSNSENVLVVWDDPVVAQRYLQHWQSRWDGGTDWRSSY